MFIAQYFILKTVLMNKEKEMITKNSKNWKTFLENENKKI